ncbi:MAG: hypothetical protein Q7S70_00760, partial [bacterium]|nr:hypothetical protein [bacterium]
MSKTSWKLFFLVFLLSFTIFNWNKISPYFNYNFLAGEIGKVFEKKEIRAEAEEFGIPKEGIIK